MWVDYRDGSNDLYDHYPEIQRVGIKTTLPGADVMLVGNGPDDTNPLIGVEAKKLWDLVGSMNTGRLQGTQIPALLDNYDVRWLLYYGDYRCGRDGSLQIHSGKGWKGLRLGSRLVPFGWLEAFLIELEVQGIHCKHAVDEPTAVQWLLTLYRWYSKPWKDHKGMRKFDSSGEISMIPGMDDRMLTRAKVASALPGIGFERAVAAAVSFPTVRDMVNADINQWMEVPGVGKTIAKAVVEAVK
jgi:hypothetical protein